MFLVIGVLAVALGALITTWLVTRVGPTQPVVAVREAVDRGEVITEQNLMTVNISVDPAGRVVPFGAVGDGATSVTCYPRTARSPAQPLEDLVDRRQRPTVSARGGRIRGIRSKADWSMLLTVLLSVRLSVLLPVRTSTARPPAAPVRG